MNQFDLTKRKAVVTGGAQGIGKAVAQRLSQSGAQVALWDLESAMANQVAASLVEGSITVQANIAKWDSVQKALTETEDRLGPIDILVNSAGIAGANATVENYPIEEWENVINIDLNGTFYTNKAVISGMRARNYGRIVNVASIAGKEGNPNASAYSAAKAGVIGFTKSLGKEVADKNISVNCVTPAAARTRIFDQMTQQHIDFMLSKIPKGRFLEVDEAASLITWLCTEEASFSTASAFDLSGGRATY